MKNILCLCDAGEVRSVAMAKVLRERGHFAVAGSYDNALGLIKGKTFISNSERFKSDENCIISEADWLFRYVIFMQEGGTHFIGRDEWGDIDHPRLRELCILKAEELGL